MTVRALFLHPSDELYGSDRCLIETVRSLPVGSVPIVLLPRDLPYQGRLAGKLQQFGTDVRYVDYAVLRRRSLTPGRIPSLVSTFVSGYREVVRIARQEQIDLVFTSTLAIPFGGWLARQLSVPHIWHVHEHIGDEPGIYQLAIRRLLRSVPSQIIANSHSVARALAGIDRRLRNRIQVVPNGIDTAAFARTEHPVSATPVIGVIGRLSPRKGTSEAIRAAALLKAHGYQFRLCLTGGPPVDEPWLLDRYRNQAHDCGLDDFVEFQGERTDPAASYTELDILLLPSQRPEPFGLVVIEAMAAGLPVLATLNGGGSDEIMEHGVSGLYCGQHPRDIARSLERLLDDDELRSQLGDYARTEVIKHYNIERYRQDMRSIITGAN